MRQYKYTCRNCGFQNISTHQNKNGHTREEIKEIYKDSFLGYDCVSKTIFTVNDEKLILDHIEAIALNGGEFDESNLQILCQDCHKRKTKWDLEMITQQRRIEALSKGNKKLV